MLRRRLPRSDEAVEFKTRRAAQRAHGRLALVPSCSATSTARVAERSYIPHAQRHARWPIRAPQAD